jgi:hypothetical protein
MMKRRFTQPAVSQATQIGAPLAIKGSTASWALPANTISDMKTISGSGRPLLPMATPVTRPQAAMPIATPAISRAPRANSGCCQAWPGGVALTHALSPLPAALVAWQAPGQRGSALADAAAAGHRALDRRACRHS